MQQYWQRSNTEFTLVMCGTQSICCLLSEPNVNAEEQPNKNSFLKLNMYVQAFPFAFWFSNVIGIRMVWRPTRRVCSLYLGICLDFLTSHPFSPSPFPIIYPPPPPDLSDILRWRSESSCSNSCSSLSELNDLMVFKIRFGFFSVQQFCCTKKVEFYKIQLP